MTARTSNMIVVSGPSGAGKSTLMATVLAEMEAVRFSVSHTTRVPRPGEADGVHYHFVDRPAFQRLVDTGAFLEHAEVHGNLYGTSRMEWDRAQAEGDDLLLDVDVQGAAQVRARFRDAVSIFVMPPSAVVLERRLRGRGPEDEAAFKLRLAAAAREMAQYREYQYAIVNDDLAASVEVLKCVIRATRHRTPRMAGSIDEILKTFG